MDEKKCQADQREELVLESASESSGMENAEEKAPAAVQESVAEQVGVREQEGEAEQKKQQAEREKRRTLRALRNLLIKLAVLALAGYLLLNYVVGIYVVHSNDMYPAVRDGDLLITYRLADYLNGNIVSYTYGGKRYFGRIVGVPGDVVEIDDEGRYTVNGSMPFETVYYETRAAELSEVSYPFTVGEGEYFVLNDLRENLSDSRSFGGIPEEDMDGSAALMMRRRGW